MAVEDDPILLTRAKVLRLAILGQRIGYLLYTVAIIAFLVGVITEFSSTVSTIATFGIVAGSVVLAPAIVTGYTVKAAVRDDVEHGRDIG